MISASHYPGFSVTQFGYWLVVLVVGAIDALFVKMAPYGTLAVFAQSVQLPHPPSCHSIRVLASLLAGVG